MQSVWHNSKYRHKSVFGEINISVAFFRIFFLENASSLVDSTNDRDFDVTIYRIVSTNRRQLPWKKNTLPVGKRSVEGSLVIHGIARFTCT